MKSTELIGETITVPAMNRKGKVVNYSYQHDIFTIELSELEQVQVAGELIRRDESLRRKYARTWQEKFTDAMADAERAKNQSSLVK